MPKIAFETVHADYRAFRGAYCEKRTALACDKNPTHAKDCTELESLFVGETVKQLVWILTQSNSERMAWGRKLLDAAAPCTGGLLEPKEDSTGAAMQLLSYRSRIEGVDTRAVVDRRLNAMRANGEVVPPHLEDLLTTANDSFAFSEAVKAMDLALVQQLLSFFRSLDPEFRALEGGRLRYPLAVVSDRDPKQPPTMTTYFRNSLIQFLTVATSDGLVEGTWNQNRDEAVRRQIKTCRTEYKQACDAVLELWFEREGHAFRAKARLHFVQPKAHAAARASEATEELTSESVPAACFAPASCNDEEREKERMLQGYLAQVFLGRLTGKFTLLSGFNWLGHREDVSIVRLPESGGVNVTSTGTSNPDDRSKLAEARTFRCEDTCGGPFSQGLDEQWRLMGNAGGVCDATAANSLEFDNADIGCTVHLKVGTERVHTVTARVNDAERERAGRFVAAVVESTLNAWRSEQAAAADGAGSGALGAKGTGNAKGPSGSRPPETPPDIPHQTDFSRLWQKYGRPVALLAGVGLTVGGVVANNTNPDASTGDWLFVSGVGVLTIEIGAEICIYAGL